ncbi:hypothetical protein RJ641_022029 [Dillenia turbinata]|uniref:Selenoprotein H n=1 Tax=Dillenia turbinata TaxID=194707 RepID=A0AAN8U8T5_9MAGN
MAPRKRRAADDDEATVKNPSTEPATRRVTRSLTAGTKGNEPSKVTVKPPAEQRPKKRTKVTASAKEKKPEEAAENEKGSENVGGSLKTIVIEHCKQCNSFKTRAIQVKDGLEAGVSGITVLVNPDKPRRGCFEIREEGGEKFISLLEMKRPFTPMKALDMDKVIADIMEKIK